MAYEHPLREWRKTHAVTLATLAAKLHVQPSHLSQVERGESGVSLDLAARISAITEGAVPVTAFVREAAE